MRLSERLFVGSQYLLPQWQLTGLAGRLAESRMPWLKQRLINAFARHYRVAMHEALHEDLRDYPSFNAFFTRALKPDARPLDSESDTFLCPVDGSLSQLGPIQGGRIIQAKGRDYSCAELLGDAAAAQGFEGGDFATLYLSPRDYHRVHMPVDGTLVEMRYIPGDLFSVNTTTAQHVPRVFARNERLVCVFDTRIGRMAMVLVGALIVGSIETVWSGVVTPARRQGLRVSHYVPERSVQLAAGAEMGRFRLGSTVILITEAGRVNWQAELASGDTLCMGRRLGLMCI